MPPLPMAKSASNIKGAKLSRPVTKRTTHVVSKARRNTSSRCGATSLITTSTTPRNPDWATPANAADVRRSEEHTSELQSRENLVCRLLLEKKKIQITSRKRKRKQ